MNATSESMAQLGIDVRLVVADQLIQVAAFGVGGRLVAPSVFRKERSDPVSAIPW